MASERLGGVDAATALAAVVPLLRAGRLLLACDFDGTLARLAPDPWSAHVIPAAQRALRRLAGSPNVHVALISGRTVADLARRARVGGTSYRGDHGAERAEAARGFRPEALRGIAEPAAPDIRALADRLKSDVPASVDAPWLVLEDKGAALTFHFRAAPDVDAARAHVVAAVDRVDPRELLVRSGTRRSLELRPPGASTKGDALADLMREVRPQAVVMLGDDGNDALAFDVLRRWRTAGRVQGLAIAVAGHADVTRDVAPRADLLLAGPEQTARLLGSLADRLARPA